MSIFGNIVSAIFGKGSTAGAATTAATGGSTASTATGTAAKPMTMDEVRAMIAQDRDGAERGSTIGRNPSSTS